MLSKEMVEGIKMVDFLVPHMPDERFKAPVVLQNGILSGVNEIGTKFTSLIYT